MYFSLDLKQLASLHSFCVRLHGSHSQSSPDHPSVKCPWLHWVSRYLSYFLFGIYHCLAVLCLSAGWLLSCLCLPLECKPYRSVNWLLCEFPFHALCVRVVIMYLESPLREVAKETWTVVHTQSEELFQGKNVLAPA